MQSRASEALVAKEKLINEATSVGETVLNFKSIDIAQFSTVEMDYLLKVAKQKILDLHIHSSDSSGLNQRDAIDLLNRHRGKYASFYPSFFKTQSEKIRQAIIGDDRFRAQTLWNEEKSKLESHPAVKLRR